MLKNWKALVLIVAGALLLAAAVWLALSGRLDRFSDWDALAGLLARYGQWSAVFLLLAQVAQVIVPIIPSQLLGMASGYLYGVLWGTALSCVGVTLGSWIAIRLARRYGRPFVERHARPETIDKIDALSERFGPWAFFLVALVPILPTDVGCFVAGLTRLRSSEVLGPITLGRLPGILALNVLGATSTRISLNAMVLITVFTLVVAAVLVRFRARLESAAYALLERLGVR